MAKVRIIGAGLAGCEAAYQLAERGVEVELCEMRPLVSPPAHHTENFGELVCSNSFKSDDPITASGLLKRELAGLGSFVLAVARENSVDAGAALAVDRSKFARSLTSILEAHPNIHVVREEVTSVDSDEYTIVAAGPLASDALAESLSRFVSGDSLSFYDAAAPIVDAESLDRNVVFAASRFGKGSGDDYLNIAMNEDEYLSFIAELVAAKRVTEKDFEKKELFSACQPVEEVARKGNDALRFGALKPVGIDDPRTGRWPYALVQLRAEDANKLAYNLVGFQTNLTFSEQKRVFGLIPGLADADFLRFGVMHRNTFVDAPRVLESNLSVKSYRKLFMAGQITGTEGYLEAVASGLLCALNVFASLSNLPPVLLPDSTVFGSLLAYATNPDTESYQPMHVNYGIMKPLDTRVRNKQQRYLEYARRSVHDLVEYLRGREDVFDQLQVTQFADSAQVELANYAIRGR